VQSDKIASTEQNREQVVNTRGERNKKEATYGSRKNTRNSKNEVAGLIVSIARRITYGMYRTERRTAYHAGSTLRPVPSRSRLSVLPPFRKGGTD
jgi:hypothetical protein